jgi:hypothetical protein
MNEILAEISLHGTGAFAYLFTVLAVSELHPTPLGARGGSWLHTSSMELAAFSILGEEK